MSYEEMKLRIAKLVFVFIFLLGAVQVQGTSFVSQIPEKKRDDIRSLFSFLLFDEGFAYVLFGSKPMSVVSFDTTTPDSFRELYHSPLFNLKSWWGSWEACALSFSIDKFDFFARRREGWFEVYLMHREKCLEVIEAHCALFAKILDFDSSSGKIYEKIVSSQDVLSEGLNQSHALLGLLLGYGRANSVRFEAFHSETRVKRVKPPLNCYQFFTVKPDDLTIPCFASFSRSETKKLVRRYQKEREEILNHFAGKDRLETALQQITSTQAIPSLSP